MINLRQQKGLDGKSAFFRKGVITIGILITGLFSAVLAFSPGSGQTPATHQMLDRDEFRRGIFLSTEENFVKPETTVVRRIHR